MSSRPFDVELSVRLHGRALRRLAPARVAVAGPLRGRLDLGVVVMPGKD